MTPLLQIDHLKKRFGSVVAVDDVSFQVGSGEIVGLLGPNGAGKTTTMRMVAGYLPADAGHAAICGFDVSDRPLEAQRRLGYLPEGAPSYGDMTPSGLLDFVARARGIDGADRRKRIGAAVERLQLTSVLHRPIETLSKGFRRRVGLAQAVLHDPQVLILDEPTDGLDPNQKHEVRALLSEIAGNKAIVLSTHILEEVEAVCTRAIVIAGGRIVADGLPEELQERSPTHNAVWLRLATGDPGAARSVLERLPEVDRVEVLRHSAGSAQVLVVPVKGRDILYAVHDAVADHDLPVDEIHRQPGRLDDVFRQLTQAAA